jgi:hypothetical protein
MSSSCQLWYASYSKTTRDTTNTTPWLPAVLYSVQRRYVCVQYVCDIKFLLTLSGRSAITKASYIEPILQASMKISLICTNGRSFLGHGTNFEDI